MRTKPFIPGTMEFCVEELLNIIDHAERTGTNINTYPAYHSNRLLLRNMIGGPAMPTVPFTRRRGGTISM